MGIVHSRCCAHARLTKAMERKAHRRHYTQPLTRSRLACGMLRVLEISNARRVVAPAEEAYGLRPVSEYTRSDLSSDAIGVFVCP